MLPIEAVITESKSSIVKFSSAIAESLGFGSAPTESNCGHRTQITFNVPPTLSIAINYGTATLVRVVAIIASIDAGFSKHSSTSSSSSSSVLL